MRLGVCYYPEQWPQSRWATDAAMMRDAGLELVRIGEFAWAAYEPERGRFDWDWLDRAIDTLGGAGLRVVLGTPTAAPPVWLATERPEILGVSASGRQRAYGSRRFTCPTSLAYRHESRRIVGALVDRYGGNETVAAWQVDNEPGNHDSARCWCAYCDGAFSSWLARRYGTIEELNRRWGTVFWSQVYPDFESVRLPVPTMTAHTPSLLLAHRRFSNEQAVGALAEQVDIIRAGSPGRDITVNHFLGDLHLDHGDAARLSGLAAHDSYPHGYSGPFEVAFTHDLARGLAGPDGRAWVMEQQAGPINWTTTNPPVPPGQARLWGWQAALHGIEATLIFRWRAAVAGQEQYHSGLLRHDATPDRGLAEVTRLGRELKAAAPRALAPPRPAAAVLFAMEDAWALEIDPHRRGLTHRQLVLAGYEGLRRVGYEVDVVRPTDDLTRYRVVVAPALHLVSAARVTSLQRAMDAGALVILGPRSLIKDEDDCASADEPQPGGGMAALLGARVVEGLSQGGAVRVRIGRGEVPPEAAGPWTDVLELVTGSAPHARVVATYDGTHLDGLPAAVRKDNLVYAGFSSAAAWTGFLSSLLQRDAVTGDREVFDREGQKIIIDHDDLSIRGVPNLP